MRSSLTLICVLVPLSSCGTQGGQGLAQAGADVIGKGLAQAGREVGDYGLACPTLPNCRTLDEAGEIRVNACDHEAGHLKPIKLCKGWQGIEHRCAAGEFEPCVRYLGAACGGYELFVCQQGRERAVLQCCARSDCEPGTLTLIEKPPPSPNKRLGNPDRDGTAKVVAWARTAQGSTNALSCSR